MFGFGIVVRTKEAISICQLGFWQVVTGKSQYEDYLILDVAIVLKLL